ncbi:MAG: hypothetical protein HXX81_05545 [Campylobacterales bacterium]|nr:hypothetical protein [Campylobacterales bacterium]
MLLYFNVTANSNLHLFLKKDEFTIKTVYIDEDDRKYYDFLIKDEFLYFKTNSTHFLDRVVLDALKSAKRVEKDVNYFLNKIFFFLPKCVKIDTKIDPKGFHTGFSYSF